MQLSLRKFEPSTIADGSVCVVIGKRNTGKSVLVKDIMSYKRKLTAGIVMSATEIGNKFYGSWVPECFIYNDIDEKVIEKLIENQKMRINTTGRADDIFLILDDCMYDKDVFKSKIMRQLLMNGRHWRIFLMMTTQYCGDLNPAFRTNIDYVFVLRDNVILNRERLFKNFFGIMPSFSSFCQLMDATTEHFECLVLDNTSHSNKLEDCVFWYKAEKDHTFKMGSPAYWRFHSSRYNPQSDEASEHSQQSKSRGLKVNVTKLGQKRRKASK